MNVCCHKTCKGQGSRQIEQFVRDLALDEALLVKETGCLGE